MERFGFASHRLQKRDDLQMGFTPAPMTRMMGLFICICCFRWVNCHTWSAPSDPEQMVGRYPKTRGHDPIFNGYWTPHISQPQRIIGVLPSESDDSPLNPGCHMGWRLLR